MQRLVEGVHATFVTAVGTVCTQSRPTCILCFAGSYKCCAHSIPGTLVLVNTRKKSQQGLITNNFATRMVPLPATAAIEYVAAGHFFPGGLLAGGIFVRGCFCPGSLFPWGHFWPGGLCPFPPSSMRIRTV